MQQEFEGRELSVQRRESGAPDLGLTVRSKFFSFILFAKRWLPVGQYLCVAEELTIERIGLTDTHVQTVG